VRRSAVCEAHDEARRGPCTTRPPAGPFDSLSGPRKGGLREADKARNEPASPCRWRGHVVKTAREGRQPTSDALGGLLSPSRRAVVQRTTASSASAAVAPGNGLLVTRTGSAGWLAPSRRQVHRDLVQRARAAHALTRRTPAGQRRSPRGEANVTLGVDAQVLGQLSRLSQLVPPMAGVGSSHGPVKVGSRARDSRLRIPSDGGVSPCAGQPSAKRTMRRAEVLARHGRRPGRSTL
jgi:hypothetical protein